MALAHNRAAAWSVITGMLATATMPAAVLATRWSSGYTLLQSGFAIPVTVAFGIAAVVLARRARALDRTTLGRTDGARTARAGRLLGILGLCMAASATIALAVYGVLLSVE